MNKAEPFIVQVSRRYAHSREEVYDAWLERDTVRRWLFTTPTGEMVSTDLDPRLGGKFNITERRDGKDVEHKGEYLELDRPNTIVFTFGVDESDYSTVRIDFRETADGCELTLTHEIPAEYAEYVERTEQGWNTLLAKLDEVLAE